MIQDSRSKKKKSLLNATRSTLHASSWGFTLIELVVSMAIVGTISGIVLANHSKFNGAILLTNLGYEMALSIRQAQIYGMSVRELSPGTAQATFQAGYGVHFDRATTNSYVFFADRDLDGVYDGASEFLDRYTMQRGMTMRRICGVMQNGNDMCSDTQSSVYNLDITFKRPDPNATINISNSSGTPIGSTFRSGRIDITSGQGGSRTIRVETTGEISIQ